jgi:glycosyltransferase involved in cell wall biosynthesis
VLIPCRNSAESILTCLESVRDMADEILVADSGSTDDTLRLVRQSGGCRIIERECENELEFEAWAQSHARHRWILRILPEEQLNPDLARQVQDTLATEPSEDGFLLSRMVHFRGRRLRHGGFQHDASIRLYRKSAAQLEIRDGQVEVSIPSQRIGALRSRLVYESCPNLEQFISERIRHAERAAFEAHQRGQKPNLRNVLWRAPWQFVRSYILRWGWLDGWAGLHASGLASLAVYLRETMLWGMQQPATGKRSIAHENGRELRVFDPQGVLVPNGEASTDLFESPEELAVAINGRAKRQARTAA